MAPAKQSALVQAAVIGSLGLAVAVSFFLLHHVPILHLASRAQNDEHQEKLESALKHVITLLDQQNSSIARHGAAHAAALEELRKQQEELQWQQQELAAAQERADQHGQNGSGGGAGTLRDVKTKLPQSSYAAICVVGHNEGGRRLQEFVAYHTWLGFGKIYLFDHNSTRDNKRDQMELLAPYIEAGKLEYYLFADHHTGQSFEQSAQGFGFEVCIRNGIGRHKWMAFFDVDEYLVIQQPLAASNGSVAGSPKPDINAFLKEFEPHAGLGVNWRMFGSSGHLTAPNSTLAGYTRCMPGATEVNKHIKTIANLDMVEALSFHPHSLKYKPGQHPVNELKKRINGPFSAPPSHTRIALHHYGMRSLAEYKRKLARGRGSTTQARVKIDPEAALKSQDAQCTEVCPAGPQLYQRCCAGLLA